MTLEKKSSLPLLSSPKQHGQSETVREVSGAWQKAAATTGKTSRPKGEEKRRETVHPKQKSWRKEGAGGLRRTADAAEAEKRGKGSAEDKKPVDKTDFSPPLPFPSKLLHKTSFCEETLTSRNGWRSERRKLTLTPRLLLPDRFHIHHPLPGDRHLECVTQHGKIRRWRLREMASNKVVSSVSPFLCIFLASPPLGMAADYSEEKVSGGGGRGG